jgi:transposase
MKTKDAHSLPAIAQQDLRKRAAKAVLDGRKQVEVAEVFGVSRQAIWKWLQSYREGGAQALKAKAPARPQGGSLFPWQSAQISKALIDHCPDQLKLPFYLWTREAVAQLIESRFASRLCVWTAGRYLARCGFTARKPLRRAFEKNPEAVRGWLDKDYPSIRRQRSSRRLRFPGVMRWFCDLIVRWDAPMVVVVIRK